MNYNEIILRFLGKDDDSECIHRLNDEFGRYQSWNIIFEDFTGGFEAFLAIAEGLYIEGEDKINDFFYDDYARSLALYLASWGMMRGSSELLKSYNYRIHLGAMEIILPSLNNLKNYPQSTKDIYEYVNVVWDMLESLKEYYEKYDVSATDTLLTKILLGVSAATPAYDQYFKKFLQSNNLTQKLGKKSLIEIWEFWFSIKNEIDVQLKKEFPPMKLIDMIGFQFGLDK